MPHSMTGFGAAELVAPEGCMRAEMRGTNGRFLEVRLRLPPLMAPFEIDLRRTVTGMFQRGRIDLTLSWEPSETAPAPVRVNAALAKAYVEAAVRLQDDLGLAGGVGLAEVLSLPGVVELGRAESPDSPLKALALRAVKAAARDVAAMRAAEGEATAAEIRNRLERLKDLRQSLAEKAPELPGAVQRRLESRLARLGVEAVVDPSRLAQEVAYIADKADVEEELTRLAGHLARLESLLDGGAGPVGKALEFLVQELHRETNTIGAKAADFAVSSAVLEMKAEIERIREQVQNLE